MRMMQAKLKMKLKTVLAIGAVTVTACGGAPEPGPVDLGVLETGPSYTPTSSPNNQISPALVGKYCHPRDQNLTVFLRKLEPASGLEPLTC